LKKVKKTLFFNEINGFFAPAFSIRIKKIEMSRVCQITGKSVMVGNNVSHSKRRTKRKFYPNLVTKKFFIPEENEFITLKISTSALRTINKKGISACVREARAKGFIK
jgi:large subunit ribosomal protein L28